MDYFAMPHKVTDAPECKDIEKYGKVKCQV